MLIIVPEVEMILYSTLLDLYMWSEIREEFSSKENIFLVLLIFAEVTESI